jgi:hypothetical protein
VRCNRKFHGKWLGLCGNSQGTQHFFRRFDRTTDDGHAVESDNGIADASHSRGLERPHLAILETLHVIDCELLVRKQLGPVWGLGAERD